ncbi:hypothetical protein ILUMI_00495, partial [Ignelater luminosus]
VLRKKYSRRTKKNIVSMESRLFGLTTHDLRKLVFQLTEQNNISHQFKNGIARLDWLKGFLKRHGNEEQGLWVPIQQLIFNCEETRASVVPKTDSKAVSKRGKHQIGALTSAERRQTVTVETCSSATEQYMPLMLISRVRMTPELLDGASCDIWVVRHPSGWMQGDLFYDCFKRFGA